MKHSKKIWLAAVFLLIFNVHKGYALTEEKACHCILGEARGEVGKYGYNSLLAVAEAIRNRGSKTQGVYGCGADLSKDMSYMKSKGLLDMALKAWRESKTSNLIKGAQYWGSTIVDKKWILTMKKAGYKMTYKIGNQEYYRKD